jgi:NADH-quinone oxidoreductase subunit H
MLVPFAVFLIASIVETNRSPFDLPEAESELVAGYHTEFSGFRFALYMLAEWVNILVLAALAITLFLGGWLRPLPSVHFLAFPLDVLLPFALFAGLALYCLKLNRESYFSYEKAILTGLALVLVVIGLLFFIPLLTPLLSGLFWFSVKLSLFIYLFIWLRATLPRLRYDQLMKFGWKWLIPTALLGLILNAVLGLAA